MTPEFSPAMLRLFIEGRVVASAVAASGLPLKGGDMKKAVKAVVRDLAKTSRQPQLVVEMARQGRVNCAMTRAGLWGALGLVPGDFGVLLTDDGGQSFASRAAGAPAGPRDGSDARSGLRQLPEWRQS